MMHFDYKRLKVCWIWHQLLEASQSIHIWLHNYKTLKMEKSRDEFIAFIKNAVADSGSADHKELHDFLVATFNNNDANGDGKLIPENIDSLVDEAAALPRKLGFAPKNEDIYPTDDAKKAARAKLFAEISGSGHITLDQWINWATEHIAAKALGLP